ncbi:MAG: hypothetical protein ACR2I2_21635 [Bryobacteraceae bacterium]
MNAVGTLPQESLAKGLWPRTTEELLAFVGIADKQEVDLSAKINDLFRQVGQIKDGLIVAAIGKRTADEFTAAALKSFNDYARVLRAKSDLLQVILKNDRAATEVLINQSLSELEADFRDHGEQRFGTAVSDQAAFTLWTIRKTANIIWKLFDPNVMGVALSASSKKKSDALGSSFALYSSWAQFHLECLTASMRLNKAIYPDVIPAILDGLRSEVNAYAIAKQMVDLYLPPVEETPDIPYQWDEEDDELLASSMRDHCCPN